MNDIEAITKMVERYGRLCYTEGCDRTQGLLTFAHDSEDAARALLVEIRSAIATQESVAEGVATTDCRSAEGITVGLIDGMIAMARIIESRSKDSHAVRQALEDFGSDGSIHSMLSSSKQSKGEEKTTRRKSRTVDDFDVEEWKRQNL